MSKIKVKYRPNRKGERALKDRVREHIQKALDEVFRTHANNSDEIVRAALERALRRQGIKPSSELLDELVPPIVRGDKPTAQLR